MRRPILILLLVLATSPAFAKSLHWRTFDVTARLDADGRLHVREQQGIVFDGDWNGGERQFNIRPGQSLSIERIVRVENGQDIPLTQGDLSQVDHWDFSGSNVIRWRSRLPSDRPFNNQELTYALEYVLSGVLQKTDRGVRLSNDFAFPDRDGVIQSFSLRLDIDPAWRGLSSPYVIRRQTIPPGEGVVVDADLVYTGEGAPAAVRTTTTPIHAAVIALLLLIAGIALTWKFYIDEKHKGRFGALLPQGQINDAWLQRNVFSIPPEAVGYAWDEMSGAPEVGAVLARMEQEKKLKSWVTHESHLFGSTTVLHMKLNVDLNTLPPGEKDLAEALFLGNTETDTDAIKEYYSSKGFQPEKLIKDLIDGELAGIPEWKKPAGVITGVEAITIFLALISGVIAFDNTQTLKVAVFAAGVITLFGLGAAITARRRIDRGPWPPVVFAWLLMAIGIGSCVGAVRLALQDIVPILSAIATAFAAASILLVSRSREAVPKIAFRRRLAAARTYFATQLRSANPNLRDQWYPYLVALGLGNNVDRWFKDFARAGVAASSIGSSGSSSSFGSSSSSSSWTGGGGAFGGAGASGSWAAMSAIAGGVATPGSSGGGGGGGGGGSSGGGGGGGW